MNHRSAAPSASSTPTEKSGDNDSLSSIVPVDARGSSQATSQFASLLSRIGSLGSASASSAADDGGGSRQPDEAVKAIMAAFGLTETGGGAEPAGGPPPLPSAPASSTAAASNTSLDAVMKALAAYAAADGHGGS